MSYCRRCGAELSTDANFCSKCGTPVKEEEEAPKSQHQTLKVTGKPKVVVVNRAPGKVSIKSVDEGEVTVDLNLREPEDLDCNVSQEGNTITVKCRALVHPLSWPRYFRSGGPRAEISLSVPKETDLEADVSLDQVIVKGLKGTINVEASVARVTVEDCEGTVNINGRTGGIDLQNVNGTVKVDCNTGSVILENVNGTVSVNNTTGLIRYSGSLSTGENWFKNTTGPIELTLKDKPDLTVEAYSRLGAITVAPELSDARHERRQYTGRLGSGTGKLIVETEIGPITIRQL